MRTSRKYISTGKRDTGLILTDQLQNFLGSRFSVTLSRQKQWASITFSGMRYTFRISAANQEKICISSAKINKLAKHEFELPGQFVADVLTHDECLEARIITIEILVIADPVREQVGDH